MADLSSSTGPDPLLAELLAARPQYSSDAQAGLCFEQVPLNLIADRFGTPTYVYGVDTIRARYASLAGALDEAGLDVAIHYAVKANDHLAILNVLKNCGAGADVVSLGELARARKVGIAPDHIVFSGVGKSIAEIDRALSEQIGQINVESAEELAMISQRAQALGKTARVALRVNPDIEAGGHHKISTGRAEDKFGIPFADVADLYVHAGHMAGVRPVGIAMHIGSQILDVAPYRAAFDRAAQLVHQLRDLRQNVEVVDCGGGLGIDYRGQTQASPKAYAAAMRASLHNLGVKLMMEPGRFLIGPAGLLLASVIREKHTGERRFVILDAAMNDLLRPSMYDAWHGILPVTPHRLYAGVTAADVVGPICETGDIFARDRMLPALAPGDRVALLDAGAYGAAMSSNYNARPRAAEVLVDHGEAHLIRARPELESLWDGEIVP
jgi:diaminopimelate decarboxylase